MLMVQGCCVKVVILCSLIICLMEGIWGKDVFFVCYVMKLTSVYLKKKRKKSTVVCMGKETNGSFTFDSCCGWDSNNKSLRELYQRCILL